MSTKPLVSPEDAMIALRSLAYQNIPLVLTSTFKGLVLSQELNIIELKKEKMTCQAPNRRLAVSLKGSTYLYSPSLSDVITAQIEDINLEQGWIIFTNLAFTGGRWKERFNARIQPDPPIFVDVICRRSTFRAELDNLSMNGIQLMAYKLPEKGVYVQDEDSVKLSFYLPNDPQKMTLKGSIVYCNQAVKLVKLGVRTRPNSSQASRLRLYIATRMAEIINELDQESSGLREKSSAYSLYF